MADSPTPVPHAHAPVLFHRAHKSALGVGFGFIAGAGIFLLTAAHLWLHLDGVPLELLGQFFQGYTVSWPGAFIGLAWGFAVGFVGGWLLGFVHNFTLGVWILFIRAKRDLHQTSTFLDHI